MEIFIEPLLAASTMVIVGAGHVGAAVTQLAKFLGFRTIVIDDRAEFLTRERLPYADETHAGDLAEQLAQLEITPQTHIVIVSRAHTLDTQILGAIIGKPAAYIGMLGSKRRVLTVMDMLKKKGASKESLERVHAPIGIEINAETPQEIAVSIMAEVIQATRQKDKVRN
jgi:xanthine dehydrogenase accessory factor